MHASVRAAWLAFTAPLEGVIPHFYKCISDCVTIAYGVRVEPVSVALHLPMVHAADGRRATFDDIADEWHRIKAAPGLAKGGDRAAKPLCQLRLTPQGIEEVTWHRLNEMVEALAERFPDWSSYPADAQLAIISLAWACGSSFDYPRCEAAIRARDWAAAAEECAIRVPPLPARSEAQRRHFLAAVRVEAEGLDPAVLHADRRDTVPGPPPAPDTERVAGAEAAYALGGWTLDQAIDEQLARDRRER
jgi:hypothetical protein